MVLPLFGLLIALLAQTGLLLADVVMAQGIAREVARTAVVDGEPAAHEVGRDLAGRRDVKIDLARVNGLLEARVELRSAVFSAAGAEVWLPARAVMRPEGGVWDSGGPGAAWGGGDHAQ